MQCDISNAFSLLLHVPEGQAVQPVDELDAMRDENVPTGQNKHVFAVTAACTPLYVLGLHGTQLLMPVAPKLSLQYPAEHALHTLELDAPVTLL